MSKYDDTKSNDEKRLSALFQQVKQVDIEAPPYLKARVLARLKEEAKYKGSLLFWKLLSFGSLTAIILLGFVSLNLYKKTNSDGLTQQAYVIHVDFNQSDLDRIQQAEVELPNDVHFVSSNKSVREERTMKLPIEVKALGRGKLPFVVSSDFSGEKEIKVRLLNSKNELVREQVLKLKFAKEGTSTTF
jgi:hypothetical protein